MNLSTSQQPPQDDPSTRQAFAQALKGLQAFDEARRLERVVSDETNRASRTLHELFLRQVEGDPDAALALSTLRQQALLEAATFIPRLHIHGDPARTPQFSLHLQQRLSVVGAP